jgi:hypothetical protein
MLSPPASDLTVANLMAMSLVQGIAGEYPNAQTNLFTGYNGNNASANRGFSKPTSSDNLTQGRGFIWYLFASGGPDASDPNGQSVVSPLPLTLRTSSFGSNANVTTAFGPSERSGGSDDGYFLLGNPFARTFDLSGIKLRNVTTNTDITMSLQAEFQVWDGGSYIMKTAIADSPNSAADDVTRWQGFWARMDPTTAQAAFVVGQTVEFTFEVASSNVVGAPVFLYKQEEPYAHLGLHLTGRLASGTSTRDEAAGFFFTDEATAGWDRYDASKLTPLSGTFATVAVWGTGPYNGRPEAKAQESLPLALRERTTYPLRLRATDAGTFTLSWPVLQNLPERWTLVLTDRAQGNTVDLRREPAYTFTAPAGTDSTRFTLTLDPGITTDAAPTPAMPDVYVSNVYPNPARNDAQVRLRLGAEGPVTVSVLDMLGREVAVVLTGAASAGTHTLAIATDLLTSGLYTLRVEAGGRLQTRRFAVVR